jgi:GntR family transcriptional regulator, rspAB operon transcriptional repressor
MRARPSRQTRARPIKAITQTRLTQTVYKLLRTRIANHDFAPGERLRPDVLSAQLGVSRTPVREALNQLAAEGLVEIRPRHGTFVAQVDMGTVAELYQLRLIIDTSAGKLIAARLTNAQLGALRRRFEKLVELVDGETYVDYGAYLESDRAFHSAIVRVLGNRRLMVLYEEINLPLWLVRAQREAGTPNDARRSIAEHEAIMRALESRDPGAVAEAMAAHIEASLVRHGVKLTPADHEHLVRVPTGVNGRRTMQ